MPLCLICSNWACDGELDWAYVAMYDHHPNCPSLFEEPPMESKDVSVRCEEDEGASPIRDLAEIQSEIAFAVYQVARRRKVQIRFTATCSCHEDPVSGERWPSRERMEQAKNVGAT